MHSTAFVHAADGTRLAIHKLGAERLGRALLVPGTFSNHTFWFGTRGIGFARVLVERGFEAWALDPRGHGASDRPRAGQDWTMDDWARRDIPAALRAAAADAPVFLVGHSAGGAALLACLSAQPELRPLVRGLVIIATPVPWLQGIRRYNSHFAAGVSRALGFFPARLLRLGPEDELPGVMRQWMRWNLGAHWTGDDGTDYSARLAEVTAPLLMLAGAGDRLFAPPAAVRALFHMIGTQDGTFLDCGRAFGDSEDFTHAGIMASRAARTEVWPGILDWLERH